MLLPWETTEEAKHPSPLWKPLSSSCLPCPIISLFFAHGSVPACSVLWQHGWNTGDPLNLGKPQASDFLASVPQSFNSLMLRHSKLGLCTEYTYSLEKLHLRSLGIKHRCLSTQQKYCVSSVYDVYLLQVFWSLIVDLWTSLFPNSITFLYQALCLVTYTICSPNSCIICVPPSILFILLA